MNYLITGRDELYHYGVPGMKWGVQKIDYTANRIASKERANTRLQERSRKLDRRAAAWRLRSEKRHSKYDLRGSNRVGVRAQRLAKRASKAALKSYSSTDPRKRQRLATRSQKLTMKSARLQRYGNALAKSTPYGKSAMRASIRADKITARAEKARYRVSKNEKYINTMKLKMSAIDSSEYGPGKDYVDKLIKK